MPTLLMTDRGIAALPRQTYFDEKTVGLALRVGAKTRTWFYVYRNGGPPQWLKVGTYPALSLSDARQKARDTRHDLDNGVDPVAERRKTLEPPQPEPVAPPPFTFADFIPTFLAFQSGRTKTWRDDAAMIDRYLLPAWGPLALRSLTRTHVHEALDTVAGKGLTIGVNRLQSLISRIFTVALDRSLIDAHPAVRMIKRFDEQPRARVLTDEELRGLWAGLEARPGPASEAVRLRLLLGQRGAETAAMAWSEVDLDAATWSLPGKRTKNQRPHVLPLPSTAVALLASRLAVAAADAVRVFPALSLTSEAHKALYVIHGGAYEWIDLRRTVATRLADLGFGEDVIGRVLNHARYGVTGKHYNQHAYLEEMRQALTAWDTELRRILDHAPKTSTNVLPMRRRS